MFDLKLDDYNFHDSTIKEISVFDDSICMIINDCNDIDNKLISKIKLYFVSSDINAYFLKQYHRFHKIKFKGREVSVEKLKEFLRKEYSIEIIEVCVSLDLVKIMFLCELSSLKKKNRICSKICIELVDFTSVKGDIDS